MDGNDRLIGHMLALGHPSFFYLGLGYIAFPLSLRYKVLYLLFSYLHPTQCYLSNLFQSMSTTIRPRIMVREA
ncbi:hypothetical protein BYT27DRAFT_6443536 [Phlegmacium glaucopus]|nr:hypothetical protein BYT27DRAFT_6443536 [Phlegmacium glaucopus]